MFMQIVVVILGVQDDEIIGNEVKLNYAIYYHFIGLLFFTLGYIPLSPKAFLNYTKIHIKTIYFSNKFFVCGYLFSIVGTVTSIATIGSIISPQEYLRLLFSGGSGLMDIRHESGSEGLSGIFKMMNYFPLGVFLISSAFNIFYKINNDDKQKLNRLIIFATISCIIKVFFSLDRLTILAIVLVFFYQNFLVKKIKLKYILFLILIFVFLSFITASRMNGSGIIAFLINYFKLSIVNFEMVIENQNTFSYGFNTFLSPLWFIMKFFGINYDIPEPEVWVWNPAQYFASYLYMDFGIFSFFIFLIIGYIVRKIQVKTLLGNLRYTSIYFIILFALVTFISVPILRAVEFWVMLVLSTFLCRFVKFSQVNTFLK